MEKVFAAAEEKMGKTVSVLSSEYAAIRAGRANASVLDKIKVDYYGTPTPINQMAAVSVAEARILTIQPWDTSTLHAIEKAIQTSDIGINPQNDGRIIRLVFPQLTEERRKELCKDVKSQGEDTKVRVRAARKHGMDGVKKLKADNVITEDDVRRLEEKVQKLTDKYVKTVDEKLAAKEKEIMTV